MSKEQNTFQLFYSDKRIIYFIIEKSLEMLVLKNTLTKIKQSLVGQQDFNELHQSWLFQIVFLSTVSISMSQIKDYIYGEETQTNLFIIPQTIRKAAEKSKKILVLDMDETLVYTRKENPPKHKNYSAIPVLFILSQYDGEEMYV